MISNKTNLFDAVSVSRMQQPLVSSQRLAPRRPHRIVARAVESTVTRRHLVGPARKSLKRRALASELTLAQVECAYETRALVIIQTVSEDTKR